MCPPVQSLTWRELQSMIMGIEEQESVLSSHFPTYYNWLAQVNMAYLSLISQDEPELKSWLKMHDLYIDLSNLNPTTHRYLYNLLNGKKQKKAILKEKIGDLYEEYEETLDMLHNLRNWKLALIQYHNQHYPQHIIPFSNADIFANNIGKYISENNSLKVFANFTDILSQFGDIHKKLNPESKSLLVGGHVLFGLFSKYKSIAHIKNLITEFAAYYPREAVDYVEMQTPFSKPISKEMVEPVINICELANGPEEPMISSSFQEVFAQYRRLKKLSFFISFMMQLNEAQSQFYFEFEAYRDVVRHFPTFQFADSPNTNSNETQKTELTLGELREKVYQELAKLQSELIKLSPDFVKKLGKPASYPNMGYLSAEFQKIERELLKCSVEMESMQYSSQAASFINLQKEWSLMIQKLQQIQEFEQFTISTHDSTSFDEIYRKIDTILKIVPKLKRYLSEEEFQKLNIIIGMMTFQIGQETKSLDGSQLQDGKKITIFQSLKSIQTLFRQVCKLDYLIEFEQSLQEMNWYSENPPFLEKLIVLKTSDLSNNINHISKNEIQKDQFVPLLGYLNQIKFKILKDFYLKNGFKGVFSVTTSKEDYNLAIKKYFSHPSKDDLKQFKAILDFLNEHMLEIKESFLEEKGHEIIGFFNALLDHNFKLYPNDIFNPVVEDSDATDDQVNKTFNDKHLLTGKKRILLRRYLAWMGDFYKIFKNRRIRDIASFFAYTYNDKAEFSNPSFDCTVADFDKAIKLRDTLIELFGEEYNDPNKVKQLFQSSHMLIHGVTSWNDILVNIYGKNYTAEQENKFLLKVLKYNQKDSLNQTFTARKSKAGSGKNKDKIREEASIFLPKEKPSLFTSDSNPTSENPFVPKEISKPPATKQATSKRQSIFNFIPKKRQANNSSFESYLLPILANKKNSPIPKDVNVLAVNLILLQYEVLREFFIANDFKIEYQGKFKKPLILFSDKFTPPSEGKLNQIRDCKMALQKAYSSGSTRSAISVKYDELMQYIHMMYGEDYRIHDRYDLEGARDKTALYLQQFIQYVINFYDIYKSGDQKKIRDHFIRTYFNKPYFNQYSLCYADPADQRYLEALDCLNILMKCKSSVIRLFIRDSFENAHNFDFSYEGIRQLINKFHYCDGKKFDYKHMLNIFKLYSSRLEEIASKMSDSELIKLYRLASQYEASSTAGFNLNTLSFKSSSDLNQDAVPEYNYPKQIRDIVTWSKTFYELMGKVRYVAYNDHANGLPGMEILQPYNYVLSLKEYQTLIYEIVSLNRKTALSTLVKGHKIQEEMKDLSEKQNIRDTAKLAKLKTQWIMLLKFNYMGSEEDLLKEIAGRKAHILKKINDDASGMNSNGSSGEGTQNSSIFSVGDVVNSSNSDAKPQKLNPQNLPYLPGYDPSQITRIILPIKTDMPERIASRNLDRLDRVFTNSFAGAIEFSNQDIHSQGSGVRFVNHNSSIHQSHLRLTGTTGYSTSSSFNPYSSAHLESNLYNKKMNPHFEGKLISFSEIANPKEAFLNKLNKGSKGLSNRIKFGRPRILNNTVAIPVLIYHAVRGFEIASYFIVPKWYLESGLKTETQMAAETKEFSKTVGLMYALTKLFKMLEKTSQVSEFIAQTHGNPHIVRAARFVRTASNVGQAGMLSVGTAASGIIIIGVAVGLYAYRDEIQKFLNDENNRGFAKFYSPRLNLKNGTVFTELDCNETRMPSIVEEKEFSRLVHKHVTANKHGKDLLRAIRKYDIESYMNLIDYVKYSNSSATEQPKEETAVDYKAPINMTSANNVLQQPFEDELLKYQKIQSQIRFTPYKISEEIFHEMIPDNKSKGPIQLFRSKK